MQRLVRKRAARSAGDKNDPSGALAQASSAVSRVATSAPSESASAAPSPLVNSLLSSLANLRPNLFNDIVAWLRRGMMLVLNPETPWNKQAINNRSIRLVDAVMS